MANRADLPFIFSLLDDPSPVVQHAVKQTLSAYGPSLFDDAHDLMKVATPLQAQILEEILGATMPAERMPAWFTWREISDRLESLEEAFYQLCRVDYGAQAGEIFFQLESLTSKFLRQHPGGNVQELMEFLFVYEGFKPVWMEEPSSLQHSLMHLLRKRIGTQEALTSLALLIGLRAGLPIEAIFIQGNLLPACRDDHEVSIYNPANGGHPLPRSMVMYAEESIRRNAGPTEKIFADPDEIILAMLIQAIEQSNIQGRSWEAERFAEMYQLIQIEIRMQSLRNRNL